MEQKHPNQNKAVPIHFSESRILDFAVPMKSEAKSGRSKYGAKTPKQK